MATDPYRLQRQTMAKHDLLRHYLPVWARILSQDGHKTLMYIDGFSFTGRYTSDEDGGPGGPGSPLIALQCFTGDNAPSATGWFLFVDERQKYIQELELNIAAWPNKRDGDKIKCRCGRFDEAVLPALDVLEKRDASARQFHYGSTRWKEAVVPAFVFIDPYGSSGFPMDLLGRVLTLPRTEVFINLMWVRTAFNLKHKEHQEHGVFTKVFGTEAWRELVDKEGEQLARAYLDLYMQRLRAPDGASARIVRHFELCGSDGALAYWMVFATNSKHGWAKMKEAMWKVDPGGGFSYRDTTAAGQGVLFEKTPNYLLLRRLLQDRFCGRCRVPIEDVEEFVLMDTPFLPAGHLKRKTLGPMEQGGIITVHRPPGKRAGSFTAGTVMDFPETTVDPH